MKLAVVFPGQGSQNIGMGLDLYNKFNIVKYVFNAVDEAIKYPLSSLFLTGDMAELTQTQNAQPAIMAVSIAIWKVLCEQIPNFSERVSFVAGHSLGEYTALCATGSLTIPQTALLLSQRGRAMGDCAERIPGAMCAVLGLDFKVVQEIVQEAGCVIANDNCPGQVVISGTVESIEKAAVLATEKGAKRAIKLPVSGAFHSPLMKEAMDQMALILSETKFAPLSIPLVENTLAYSVSDEKLLPSLLTKQITGSVLWTDSVKFMIEQGCDTFIECGPGKVLSGLIKKISADVTVYSVNDIPSLEQVKEVLC